MRSTWLAALLFAQLPPLPWNAEAGEQREGLNSQTGTVKGTVSLADSGLVIHHASVVLVPLGRRVETGEDGTFRFEALPPGKYALIAHMHALTDEKKEVSVAAGQVVEVQFRLHLAPVREAITITAEGHEVATAEAFQTVTSLEGYELGTKSTSSSLGDLLEGETGIAKRSFGPGTTRPVVRGFDGDRVLVLQDGVRSGTLSSQSGDHGEPVDASAVDRVEVVRGPATLLYGSNAIGGVVNVITGHHILHQHPHEGLHATINGTGGTTNSHGGVGGNFELGRKHWLFYGGSLASRAGNYRTPQGEVENSGSDAQQGSAGAGRFGERASFNLNYGYQSGDYGVPYDSAHAGNGTDNEGPVDLTWRRHNAQGNLFLKKLGGAVEQLQVTLGYTDWNHNEIAGGQVGTRFFNRQFTYRGTAMQRKRGPWTGSFGVWGMARDYEALGTEALSPPVNQNAFAAFGLEELSYQRVRFQFGGRLENNSYDPAGLSGRSFTGVSASAGVLVPLWESGAIVANYIHSYRAPAMEELYNKGPHPGNAVYEVGNPNLKRELSDGVEVSLRHQGKRLRQEMNLYRYQMHDFVYLRLRGQEIEGLPVADYAQAGVRYLGAEAKTEFRVKEPLWLMLGFDVVDANLTAGGRENLPRIPPTKGKAGLMYAWKSLTVKPEVALTNRQWQVSPNETPTAGYVAFQITASYSITRQHHMHTFQVSGFNLGDRLYRNHLSFIKSYAPEIGRGVRISYSLNLY